MTRAPGTEGFVLKGWHVLAMLLAFFGTVIGVDVTFSVLALRTFPGEDVRNSYVQGNHYNETLAQRARGAALGWRATADIEPGAGASAVIVTLRDNKGAPLDGLTLTGRLRRPATTRADRPLAFVAEKDGRYVARTPGLQEGAWDLEAVAARGSQSFEIGARLSTSAASES